MPRGLILVLFLIAMVSCTQAAESLDEYRESRKQVVRHNIKQTDNYLRIAVFVRLKDGSIQLPKLYRFQPHYTAAGVQSVEKGVRLFSVTTKDQLHLYLPHSEKIADYLLLISQPVVKETKAAEKTTTKATGWTDWFLLKVPAKTVETDKVLVLPALDQLAKSQGDADLLKNLRSSFRKAEIAAEKKMSTPVRDRSEVPPYAQ